MRIISGSTTTKVNFTSRPFVGQRILETSPQAELLLRRVCEKILANAVAIFEFHNRKDNEWRVSQVTPPKYVSSFKIERAQSRLSMRVVNTDPGWNWVEYGTHAGGKTFIMRYRPLGRALDMAAAGI